MNSSLALFLWFVLLVGLLCFDPAKERGISGALWVPVIWMFITATRLPSQWLGGGMGQAAQALEDGNPFDRIFNSALILLAIGILMSRSFNWSSFFAQNVTLMAFLFFALLSVIWSDFPLIAFKRWFRDLGAYLIIGVTLSDRRPLEAVRALFRRFCYLLIPLSVLLVKYYPYIGKRYSFWTGAAEFVGATSSKNMLGAACLVSGIFFFWDTVIRWSTRKDPRTKRILLLNAAFFAMTFWLLNLSNSATSQVCLVIGCLVITAAHTTTAKRRPALLKVLIPIGIGLYMVLRFAFGIDLSTQVAASVGRDSTLTGRTVIWDAVLSTHTNPIVGTGYESFWLGPRLTELWPRIGAVNEAHNGYLETYLTLGLLGLFLLLLFLVVSYRTICNRLRPHSHLGTLSLALWTVLLIYNVTESALRGQLMWVIFLFMAVVVPARHLTTRSKLRTPPLPTPASKWRTVPTI